MTATTIRVQMAQRKDTAANWTSANPILLSGEIGYETDTKKFKIGNGSSNWNNLAYLPIPDGSGNLTITGNLEIGTTGSLTFEGSTADGFETTLAVTNPTADRTITLPDRSGTVITSGDTGTVTSTMLADGTIVNADISTTAEIAVSKLANGTANQIITTDGTDVSWSSNLNLAGNATIQGDLTVNGTTTTIDTQTLLVEDKNIEMGVVATPTDVTADGGGITLRGTTNKTVNWSNATSCWTSSENFDLAAGKSYFIDGAEVINSTSLGIAITDSTLTSVGTLGNLTVADFVFAGTFIPDSTTAPFMGMYAPAANTLGFATDSVQRITIDPNGNLTINAQGDLRFADSDSSNWVAFQAPATVASNVTWTLPSADGTSGQVLSTNGSGTLSWSTAGGGATDKIEEGNSSAEVIDTGSDGRFVVTTEGTEALRVDSSRRLLVGTSSARTNVYSGGGAVTPTLQLENNTNTWSNGLSILNYSGSQYGASLALGMSASNTPGTNALVSTGNLCGRFHFLANDGTNFYPIAEIGGWTDGATGTGDVPGRLTFSTTADGASSPTERMRITNNGTLRLGDGTTYYHTITGAGGNTALEITANAGQQNALTAGTIKFLNSDSGGAITERMRVGSDGTLYVGQTTRPTTATVAIRVGTSNASGVVAQLASDTGTSYPWSNYNAAGNYVGGISCTSTATSFPTSSDYRLKTNIQPLTGAIDIVSQLKPSTFEFHENPGETVQGFIAHELQEVVPLAVVGEKDAEDSNGRPIYQGVDAAKLVPCLTAALQEAIGEIESLKARVAALESA